MTVWLEITTQSARHYKKFGLHPNSILISGDCLGKPNEEMNSYAQTCGEARIDLKSEDIFELNRIFEVRGKDIVAVTYIDHWNLNRMY